MKHQPAGTLWKLSVFSGTAIPMDSFIKKTHFLLFPVKNSHWQLISKHPILVDFFRTHWDRNDPFFAENLLLFPRRIEVSEMNGFQGQRQGTRFLEGLEVTVTSSPPPSHPTWPLWYPRPSPYDSRLLFHSRQTLATFAQASLLYFPT